MFSVKVRSALIAATILGGIAPLRAETADEAPVVDAGNDPIIITGKREGYSQNRTSSATKTDTDLQNVPQAITVVTEEQIADQALRSLGDVVRYVPGVSMESGEGHRDAVVIRGNISTADFFSDGLRDDVEHYRGIYNVERVEVLKGPNALIFGRGGGGGVINRVTKKPFDRRYLAGALSIDSEGADFGEIDVNDTFGYKAEARLNATYERFDNFRHIEGDRYAINPTLAFHAGEQTRIDLGYEFAKDKRDVDRGLPPAFAGSIDNPAEAVSGFSETFFGVRGVNRSDFEKHVVTAAIDHRFSSSLRFTSKALYGDYDKQYRNAVPSSAVTDIDGVPSVLISAYEDSTDRQNFLWQNDLVAEFATGSIRHVLLTGIDYSNQDTKAARLRGFFDSLPDDQKSSNGRETYVPLAEQIVIAPITFRSGSGERNAATDVEAVGVYIQDQVGIGEHIDIIAGIRRDWIDIRVQDFIGASDLSRSDDLWSPRLGLVVRPRSNVSVYASWSRSYLPQSGDQFSSLSPTTASLKPEEFTNREIGVKWALTSSLDLTLAAYQLDRENTRAIDPATMETVLTGGQRTEGVEFGLSGKVGKLSLAGGLSFQDAEISRDTTAAPAGRPVPNVPDFQASLWGRYDLGDRLGIGLGVTHRSKIFASFTNAVVVNALTLVDAGLFYDLTDRIGLQVNVDNLLGEDGIEFAHGDFNLTPVDKRTVRATLRFGF